MVNLKIWDNLGNMSYSLINVMMLLFVSVISGQKPFECEICQKSFTQKGQLKEHRRIHSGELPYQCGFCEKSFRNSSALVTHLRIHTGKMTFRNFLKVRVSFL